MRPDSKDRPVSTELPVRLVRTVLRALEVLRAQSVHKEISDLPVFREKSDHKVRRVRRVFRGPPVFRARRVRLGLWVQSDHKV